MTLPFPEINRLFLSERKSIFFSFLQAGGLSVQNVTITVHLRQILLFGFIAFFLTGCQATLQGQQSGKDVMYRKDAPDRLNRQFVDAYSMFMNRSMQQALRECDRMIRRAPNFIDALLLRGDIYMQQGNFFDAIKDYEAALKLDPDYRPGIHFTLGKVKFQQQLYIDASSHLKQFLTYDDFNEKLRDEAIMMIKNAEFIPEALKNPVPFDPINLGPGVNSNAPEYLPSLTIDGQTLIFTRRTGNREDFWVSHFEDGQWQPAYPLGPPVNTEDNEGAQSLSADGRTLVYTVCNRADGFGSCDLKVSYLRGDQWTEPVYLPAPVNTSYWESQPALSSNGKTLYFTSNRPGGIGGKDIWVSYETAPGKWSEPENLGDVVNTRFDEQSPFLHADGETLYFASDGHPGMGNEDIYLTRIQADGTWSEPLNLGYPINTSGRENSLIVSADGVTAYFATNRMSRNVNNLDIFKFELPEHLRPTPTTWVEGKVTNEKAESIEANIEVYRIRDGKELGNVTSFEGEYLMSLPVGEEYGFRVEHPGYLFYSDNFVILPGHDLENPYRRDILLQRIPSLTATVEVPEVSRPVVLRNVFFSTGSAALRPESFVELNRLINLLQDYPEMKIAIHGHTDNVGDDAMNLELSKNRAKSVFDYLVQGGINAERLQSDGFGATRPMDSNDTEEGRQNNRRTEFVVLSR